VFLFSKDGHKNIARSIVAGLACYQFILLSLGLILGHSGVITPVWYGGILSLIELSLIGFIIAGCLQKKTISLKLLIQKILKTQSNLALRLLSIGIGSMVAIQFISDWIVGTSHIDGLQYHLPRVMFWSWNSNFVAWPSPVWQQLGLPVAADLILGTKLLMGLGWNGAAYVNIWITVGAGVCVYIVARDFRFTHWQSSIATILFLSFPAIGLRMGHMNSDMMAAFPVIAGYALWRTRPASPKGVAIFILLSGIAISCKITVLPFIIILGLLGLWRQQNSIFKQNILKTIMYSLLALVLAIIVLWGSYYPVYEHFGDFLGGDYHLAGTILANEKMELVPMAFKRVLFSIAQWIAEPLGYIPRLWRDWLMTELGYEKLYTLLGVGTGPSWWPNGAPDTTRTGLIPFAALPILFFILPRKIAIASFLLILISLIGTHAPLPVSPWRGRYTVVLLAGYSLLWIAPFKSTNQRWKQIILILIALNVSAAVFSTGLWSYRSITQHLAKKTGSFGYFTGNERRKLANDLNGEPLLVISESGTLDALISGPEIAFKYKYIVCPGDGGWEQTLKRVHKLSTKLVVLQLGNENFIPGPLWSSLDVQLCPNYSDGDIQMALVNSGWKFSYRKDLYNGKLELWSFSNFPL